MTMLRGEGLVAANSELATLTNLMELSCRVADAGQGLLNTEDSECGMRLMEAADHIAEQVGVIAERQGFTPDEVITPLWRHTGPTMPREG